MSDDRIQQALAAHLEQAELGGPAPDTSHLSDDERAKLQELIRLLDATQRVPLGLGLGESGPSTVASTEAGERLAAAMRMSLPAGARIFRDPTSVDIPTMDVVEGFIVGTFGGRVRVWLLADEGSLAGSDAWLRGLERVFRLFPDTVAIALVEPDHSCLLVQPEDCAPTIEVPIGSLVGRHYRRPVAAVEEALPAFVRELIPQWEPSPDVGDQTSRVIDIGPIAAERASVAIADQAAAGSRARKTNPKRDALLALGDAESSAVSKLVVGLHEGRVSADDVEAELRRLASNR